MLYWIVKGILTPTLSLLYRVRVEGRENLPKDGAFILAPNHRSFMDSMFLGYVVRRRVTFVAKAEYFHSWKTRWIFRGAGQIPIDRNGGEHSKRGLDSALDVLQAGGILALYPEGTRSRDGLLHRGQTGVARLAARAGVPIVPVGILGTDEIMPPDAPRPHGSGSVTLRFGSPVAANIDPADRSALRSFTDELMREIQLLSESESAPGALSAGVPE